MTAPARPDLDDPARRPRTLGQRLQLLLILLILPAVAVAIPTALVTYNFGQRPAPKTPPKPASTVRPSASTDRGGLEAALSHSASLLLPTPAPLTPDPITLRVHPDHVTARAEKVARQARAFGGTAVEGVSDPGEKHLYVDLPAGNADSFRRALDANTLPTSPAAPSVSGASRDQLEVIVRPTADDE